MRRPLSAGAAASCAGAVTIAVDDPAVREVRLDPATAALLEARARARGLTLAEYLTELAVFELETGPPPRPAEASAKKAMAGTSPAIEKVSM